ncbi:MAG: hypothetical protein GKS04_04275 [Candidatus Mycalebacterium zealandia]|nr:MAG: hypothetical protein GKS04_04275 [Candidatus Mycalebacterium zealandia]
MLRDRRIDFGDPPQNEWNLLKEKIGDGIEYMLPDSQRWFLAKVDGDGIRITAAERNVRPLSDPSEPLIGFGEFSIVAGAYNQTLFGGINNLQPRLNAQKKSPNMRYIFMLIYNLL